MSFVFVINFKTYEEGTAEKALELAQYMEKVSNETGKKLIAAVQPADIQTIRRKVPIELFAQHIDPVKYGSSTGWILPHSVKAAGATGTLINHSEHPLPLDEIKRRVDAAKTLGLKALVCAPTPEDCAKIASLKPDFIAVEPPELIGSGIPVSKARPEVIIRSRETIPKNIPLLCGAGINDGDDIKRAKELGASGVLVASAIVKAKDRLAALRNLVSGV